VVKPRWSDGGKQRRPNVITLVRTRGFGLDRDPREASRQPERPEPKRRGTWRHWRKQ
jgi:hypothetical protein